MTNNKLDKNGLSVLWTKFFELIKRLTGDVKVSEKGTLQAQIDGLSDEVTECFTSVSNGKTLVASAITDKGIITAADAEFATMAENVLAIETNPTLQSKSTVLHTGNTSVTMAPDEGYDGLSQATASISTQTKTQAVTYGTVTVSPDSGKVLSGVTINGPTNYGSTTQDGTMTQDSTYTYLAPKTNGYYDTASKLRVANSNLSATQVLLWTNPATPSTAFAAQELSIDLTEYTHIIVYLWLGDTADETHYSMDLVPIDGTAHGCGCIGTNRYGYILVGRYVTANSSSVVFSNGYYANVTTCLLAHVVKAVPFKIYGVKLQ